MAKKSVPKTNKKAAKKKAKPQDDLPPIIFDENPDTPTVLDVIDTKDQLSDVHAYTKPDEDDGVSEILEIWGLKIRILNLDSDIAAYMGGLGLAHSSNDPEAIRKRIKSMMHLEDWPVYEAEFGKRLDQALEDRIEWKRDRKLGLNLKDPEPPTVEDWSGQVLEQVFGAILEAVEEYDPKDSTS